MDVLIELFEKCSWIFAILWVLDQIAAATPETMKIGKFPIGKYDNIVMSFIKELIQKIRAGKTSL